MEKVEKVAHAHGYRVLEDGTFIGPRGKVLKTEVNEKGYLYVAVKLKACGKRKLKVHRLQAYQKFGDALYAEGIMCRHLNGNCKDNRLENIAIGTASDNMMDMPREERVAKSRKAIAARKDTYPLEVIRGVRKDLAEGMKPKAICEKRGIKCCSTIYYIKNHTYGLEIQ